MLVAFGKDILVKDLLLKRNLSPIVVAFGKDMFVRELLLKRKLQPNVITFGKDILVNTLLWRRKQSPIFSNLLFFSSTILLFLSNVITISTPPLASVFIKIFLLSLSFSIFISHISPIVSGKQSLIYLS